MNGRTRLSIAAALIAATACTSPPVAPLVLPTSTTTPASAPSSAPSPSPFTLGSTPTPAPAQASTSAPVPTVTPSPSHTPIPSPTPMPAPSPTYTLTPTATFTPTPTPTLEILATATPTPAASPTPTPTSTPIPAPIPTPHPTPQQQYYTQFLQVKGINVKASSKVAPEALKKAAATLEMMLKGRADIAERLAKSGTDLAVIPKDEYITTLPEYKYLSGKIDPNGNPYDSFTVRGGGAIPTQLTTATSEENLLNLPSDPYRGLEDIAVHELGHAVMNLGFTLNDKERLRKLYDDAKERKVFPPKTFGLVNPDEFFAELSQSYFNVNNEMGNALAIKEKIPEAFKFLEEIYGPLAQSFINMRGDRPLVLLFASPITAATANGYGNSSCRKIPASVL